jgi:hypothetical protein
MDLYFLYAHDRCDRCGKITAVRTMSFFTHQTLCMDCLANEGMAMAALRAAGANPADFEGCGCIPDGSAHGPCAPDPRLADVKPRVRITEADVRGALRRLRARSALLRIPPGYVSPRRDLPPMH